MKTVNTEWNGIEGTYEVDYAEQPMGKRWRGPYAAEVQVRGLHAHSYEMQVASNLGHASFELPPLLSAGLREPNVPNPYLSKGDAPDCSKYNVHTDYSYGSFPVNDWNPYNGAQKSNWADIEPKDAWVLGENDLQSLFLDYF